jgi:hypothetical protein
MPLKYREFDYILDEPYSLFVFRYLNDVSSQHAREHQCFCHFHYCPFHY